MSQTLRQEMDARAANTVAEINRIAERNTSDMHAEISRRLSLLGGDTDHLQANVAAGVAQIEARYTDLVNGAGNMFHQHQQKMQ